VLSVAIVAAGYHGRLLLGDLAWRVAAEPTGSEAVSPTDEAARAVIAAPGGDGHASGQEHIATVALVLEVPEDQDATAVVAGLRSHLPPGAQLRVRPAG
jgi:hypothetical protein